MLGRPIINLGVVSPVGEWSSVDIGAGGFNTGLRTGPDGTVVVRTDTYGAYSLNRATEVWQQVVTSLSMPSGDVALGNGNGVFEIAISQSSPNIWYMVFNGYVYQTTNKGTTWTKLTAVSQDTAANPNGNNRTGGPRIAIDPVNPNTVVIGLPTNGVMFTTNGGTSWTTVSTSSIPASQAPGGGFAAYLIAADPSTSSGGNTPGWYVHSYGNGLYHTSNLAGGTWTLVSGMPTGAGYLKVDASGNVFLTDDSLQAGASIGHLWKYNGTASEVISSSYVLEIAVSLSTPSEIWALTSTWGLAYSSNTGASFSGGDQSLSAAYTEIPWLAACAPLAGWYGVNIEFDPLNPSSIFMSSGLGTWETTPSNDGTTAITWTEISDGIEQLVSTWGMSVPDGNPIYAFYDRGVFVSPDGVFPSTYFPLTPVAIDGALEVGWSCDYAPNNPSVLVALINFEGNAEGSGKSTDGGNTWSLFTTSPLTCPPGGGVDGTHGGFGGCIAAASDTNYVMIRCDNSSNTNQPYYTTDGGETWNPCSFPGPVPTVSLTGWPGDSYDLQQILCADRVDGTFYAYNQGIGRQVSSGTYNSSTGAISLTLADGNLNLSSGVSVSIQSLTATGSGAGNVGSIDNNGSGTNYTTTSGTSGTTVNFTGPTGLGSMTITGGYVAPNNIAGLYTSPTGETWTRVNSTDLSNGTVPRLRVVPYNAGHVLYTTGAYYPQASNTAPLKWTTNHGVNFSSVSGIEGVLCFGFGKAAPGQSYPSVYAIGNVSGVYGVWRTITGLASPTWVQLLDLSNGSNPWPDERFDRPYWIDGDLNTYGVCRIGFEGSAVVKGIFS
jgi:hypothetical protein